MPVKPKIKTLKVPPYTALSAYIPNKELQVIKSICSEEGIKEAELYRFLWILGFKSNKQINDGNFEDLTHISLRVPSTAHELVKQDATKKDKPESVYNRGFILIGLDIWLSL